MLTPELKRLCDTVRETSFGIHRYLRSGHLEKVYQNALVHRLGKQGLRIQPKHPLNVYDEDGTLADEHVAQLLGYLRASRIEDGLLINFAAQKLQSRKYVLSQEEEQLYGQN